MDPWPVNFARALAAGTWGPLPEPAAPEQPAMSPAITDIVTSSVTDRRPCTGFPPGMVLAGATARNGSRPPGRG